MEDNHIIVKKNPSSTYIKLYFCLTFIFMMGFISNLHYWWNLMVIITPGLC